MHNSLDRKWCVRMFNTLRDVTMYIELCTLWHTFRGGWVSLTKFQVSARPKYTALLEPTSLDPQWLVGSIRVRRDSQCVSGVKGASTPDSKPSESTRIRLHKGKFCIQAEDTKISERAFN